MAVNEAALKSMAKMIQVMLPYEGDYEPKEPSTQCISEIFELIRGYNPKINEFEGFMNYIMKNMDVRGDMNNLDRMLMEIWAIINEHYPPSGATRAGVPVEQEQVEDKGEVTIVFVDNDN